METVGIHEGPRKMSEIYIKKGRGRIRKAELCRGSYRGLEKRLLHSLFYTEADEFACVFACLLACFVPSKCVLLNIDRG